MGAVRIGEHMIGDGPAYVIAEAGVNHNGDIVLAKKLIDAARSAGADAVKFQTFTPHEIVTEHAAQAAYQATNTGIVESQSDMLKKLALSYDNFRELKAYAEEGGIEFLSTPFSVRDADFLHSLDLAAYKVSSGDLTDLPSLAHLATFRKPVLLSTGMATLAEVRTAVETLEKGGAPNIVLLQCTSEYPSPITHANLRVMATFRKEFGLPVGFSDHTLGTEASVYAASLGAAIIEKHFTLDRNLPGPDHRASLEPHELKDMVAVIRAGKPVEVPEEVLGSGIKEPTPEERVTARLVRKGVAARTDIEAGEALTEENTFIVRPEGEISPKDRAHILGKRTKRHIARGTSLTWDMLTV